MKNLRAQTVAAACLCLLLSPLVAASAPVQSQANQEHPAPVATAAAPVEQQTRNRAQAYYHFALGYMHLLEDMGGFGRRSDSLQRAIEEFQQALQYDPDSHFLTVQLAEAYHRRGRTKEAVEQAEGVLKADPANLPARRLLARIYLQTLGELQPSQGSKRTLGLAIEQYEAIARLAPEDTESRLLLARLYRLNNEPDKSEAALKTLLADQPRSEQALAGLAQLYSDRGDYARAIALLKESTAQQPSSELLATLAYAYQQAGDFDNAIAAYRGALDQDGENIELRKRLAQALLEAARYDQAIVEYQALARLNPNDFESHLRLSHIYRQRGQFDMAARHLAQARTITPDNPEVGFHQALLHEAEGKFPQAVQVLSDLVAATGPAQGSSYNEQERRTRAILFDQLGQLQRRLENYDAAIAAFERLRELGEEEEAAANGQIIETLRQARAIDAAIARAEQALARFPEITGFRLQLATLLGDRGELARAVEFARGFLNGQPQDREVYLALSQIYERNKRYPEAEQAVAEAEKFSSSRTQLEHVHFLRGAIYERQKKYELAEPEFRRVLAMNPASAITLNYLGYMLADRGVQLEESVELIKRALEIDPYNGAYLDSLGWAYYRQAKFDLAEEYLRRASERTRYDPTIHDHLGDLYEKLGRFELAATHWERSLAEWKRTPKTEFDPEAFGKTEAKLRAVKIRPANPIKKK